MGVSSGEILHYETWNLTSIYGNWPFHLSFAPFSISHFKMAPTPTEDDTTATNQDGKILPHADIFLFKNKTGSIFDQCALFMLQILNHPGDQKDL